MGDCFIQNRRKEQLKFDYTGITAYFDVSSLNLTNVRWENQIADSSVGDIAFNTNNNTYIYYSEAEDALRMENAYGTLSIPSDKFPYTIYIILKCNINSTSWYGAFSKTLSSNSSTYSWDTFFYNNKIWFEDVEVASNDAFHIIAYTYDVNTQTRYMYADGQFVRSNTKDSTYVTGLYSGSYQLNRSYRGGWNSGNAKGSYKLIACGTEFHTEEQIMNNMKFLMDKYKV